MTAAPLHGQHRLVDAFGGTEATIVDAAGVTVSACLPRAKAEAMRAKLDAERFTPTHRHYKGGLYQKLFEAKHSETGQPLIVYRAQDGSIWCRPKAMFEEVVVWGRAGSGDICKPRFEPLEFPLPRLGEGEGEG